MPDALPLIAYVIAVVGIEVHQVDAGAEREWDVLHMPGRRPGFLIVQGLLVVTMLIGLVLVARGEPTGTWLGATVGAGGLLGAGLHVALWRRGEAHFRSPESVASVACMAAAGVFALTVFVVRLAAGA